MRRKSPKKIGVVGLVAVLHGQASAIEASQAVSAAMGNTTRSNSLDPASIYAAPGLVWVGERFELGAGGAMATDGTRSVFVGAHDGQTSSIGLGVQWLSDRREVSPTLDELPGWRRTGQTFDNNVESSVLSATIGAGGVNHMFGLGLGLRYYYRASTLGGSERAFNVAPSVAGVVGEQWVLSLTVENPIPMDYPDAPFAIGTGTRWQPSRRFAVAVDTLTDLGTVDGEVRFTPMVGTEVWVHDMVPMRVGWTQDGVSQRQLLTAGVGVASESFDVSYACAGLWSSDEGNVLHRISVRLAM